MYASWRPPRYPVRQASVCRDRLQVEQYARLIRLRQLLCVKGEDRSTPNIFCWRPANAKQKSGEAGRGHGLGEGWLYSLAVEGRIE